MPISTEEKLSLEAAVASFSTHDFIALARLLYTMLLDAKISKHNPHGMGWKAVSSLGRLTKDKAPWESIKEIEAAIEAPIRLPLIKSCDSIFRTRIITDLPQLEDEHKQTLAFVIGKMDDVELASMTKLLYEVVSHTEFPDDNAQTAFGKFFWAGYTWDELANSPDVMKGILLPIVYACRDYFTENFPLVFGIEDAQEVQPGAQPELSESEQNETPTEETPDSPLAEPTDDELAAELAKLEADNEDDEGIPTGKPNDPMPIPEFAPPEEVAAREKADAEKPKFNQGRKSKRGKKKDRRNKAAAQAQSDSPPVDDDAAPDSPDASAEEAPSEALQESLSPDAPDTKTDAQTSNGAHPGSNGKPSASKDALEAPAASETSSSEVTQ